jgi:inward rectifier potassium channel
MNETASSSEIRARLVPRGDDDKIEINRSGQRNMRMGDLYIRLLSATWRQLLCGIVVLYLSINILFMLAYIYLGSGISHARPGSFIDAFFFSVQTMSTIGYGNMSPVGLATNLLVTLQVLNGFGFFALVTGLVFSKFSRPTARVMFSNVAVICPYNGVPHFMFRLANERNNRIVDANIHVAILKKETTTEGHEMRKFHDLKLLRSRNPILQLSWSVMHMIDETSPLYHATPENLREWDAEIIVSLTGLDETLSQTIHARFSYIAEDIICNSTFVDILKRKENGRGVDVDYSHFHEVKSLVPEDGIPCMDSTIVSP